MNIQIVTRNGLCDLEHRYPNTGYIWIDILSPRYTFCNVCKLGDTPKHLWNRGHDVHAYACAYSFLYIAQDDFQDETESELQNFN